MPIKNEFEKIIPVTKNGRFFNNNETRSSYNWSEYFSLINSFFHEIAIFTKSFLNAKRAPKNSDIWCQKDIVHIESSLTPSIAWIGHATFLIQIGGVNILTDPIFGGATVFFPRIFPPPISVKNLPKIDYVLISHNHLDHMDATSLFALKNQFPGVKFLVPLGDKNWFIKRGFTNVTESTWWDVHEFEINNLLDQKIRFTFLPAQHWSQRNLFDQNKSLWGSWMIEYNNFKIYFAGDTAYSPHFGLIAKEFQDIDIALMPIGPCEPREKMCHSHVNAQEAGQAFLDLKAKHFIPMHWGTFYFGVDNFDTPIIRLKQWWQQNSEKLNFKKLNISKFGQRLDFNFNLQTLSTSQKELFTPNKY